WTSEGKPSLDRIRALVGDNRVSQELVNEAAGDLVRINKAATPQTGEKSVKAEKQDKRYVENVKVRATARGQYGGKMRVEGDEFFVTGILRPWMERVKVSKSSQG